MRHATLCLHPCSFCFCRRIGQLAAVARKAPGLHLIGDLYGCHGSRQLMVDAATLEAFCKQTVADAGLTAVGSLFHSFGEGEGVTGAVVLAGGRTWRCIPGLKTIT